MSRVTIKTFKSKVMVEVPGEPDKVEQEFEFAVLEPTNEDFKEARKKYNSTFSEAVISGAIVRERLDTLLREQGMWSDKTEQEFQTIQREIADLEKRMAAGGININQAKDLALEIVDLRNKIVEILSPRTQLDAQTAQGQADNEQFNCLVSRCVVYNDTQQKYFKSYADYMNNQTSDVANQAANILAKKMYGVDESSKKDNPEVRFLKYYKFMDSAGRLINEEGDLIDREGRLINEEGRLVDKDGNLIDEKGDRINNEGEFLVEFTPFLDNDGNEIDGNWGYGQNEVKEKKAPAKKTTRKASAKK